MRLHAIIFTVLAAAVAANYYNGAFCESSLDCLKICQQGDFKVVQDSDGRPQLACAAGIIEYSRKTCLSRHGSGDESVRLLTARLRAGSRPPLHKLLRGADAGPRPL
ncbi:uncharacterized protein LMH87_008138 [Akanthomyces muscarius]|uniref:Uncharacterized protein n=1 Tax=Akanthomyces muscarius TaxID=2231603 RepID=A0A9W8QIQ7_AKAMU|nr:uncharacterized protein LMH87_008138 [Akanthomyces muscarius]KAJ4159230.1 hypothetical protein LMH87_008138 [Akanthomyces muscarius]